MSNESQDRVEEQAQKSKAAKDNIAAVNLCCGWAH